jgi:hypothetical protein
MNDTITVGGSVNPKLEWNNAKTNSSICVKRRKQSLNDSHAFCWDCERRAWISKRKMCHLKADNELWRNNSFRLTYKNTGHTRWIYELSKMFNTQGHTGMFHIVTIDNFFFRKHLNIRGGSYWSLVTRENDISFIANRLYTHVSHIPTYVYIHIMLRVLYYYFTWDFTFAD